MFWNNPKIIEELRKVQEGLKKEEEIVRVNIVDGLGELLSLNQTQVTQLKDAVKDGKITNDELNNDELDYKKLGTIQNGGDAMDTIANLYLLKDKSKIDEIRKDLLAYCHLDTLAMLRIYEKLKEIVKD